MPGECVGKRHALRDVARDVPHDARQAAAHGRLCDQLQRGRERQPRAQQARELPREQGDVGVRGFRRRRVAEGGEFEHGPAIALERRAGRCGIGGDRPAAFGCAVRVDAAPFETRVRSCTRHAISVASTASATLVTPSRTR
jgi:hypothetical protein